MSSCINDSSNYPVSSCGEPRHLGSSSQRGNTPDDPAHPLTVNNDQGLKDELFIPTALKRLSPFVLQWY